MSIVEGSTCISSGELELVGNVTVLYSQFASIEEGVSIQHALRHRARRLEKDPLEELEEKLLRKALEKQGELILRDVVSIITEFLKEHELFLKEWIKMLEHRMRGTIIVKDDKLVIIDWDRYLNLLEQVYDTILEGIHEQTVLLMRRHDQAKEARLDEKLEILSSLHDVIMLVKTLALIAKTRPRLRNTLLTINTLTSLTLLRDMIVLKTMSRLPEKSLRKALDRIIREDREILKQIRTLATKTLEADTTG